MDDFIDEISKVFINIDNEHDMKKFLSEIFTENEINDIKLRWQLLKMLKDGKSQRYIAKDLKISLCKITRGAKILKDKESMINKILDDYTIV